MAAAIATNDAALFQWSTTIPYAVFLRQLKPNSTLPSEASRGTMATYYHGLSAGALTMMAYLSASQGVDLYSQGDYALRRLNLLVAGWVVAG